ncbi:MAG: 1-acyl-sn-glycerol-3-phosphate acyltransferase [bacterium]
MKKKPFSYRFKIFLAKAIHPLFSWYQKKKPEAFAEHLKKAGNLDLSAMLTEFNFLHRFFFRDTLNRIQIEKEDLEKIRQASSQGPIVYMMRNWGQIEYNYFNSLFLKEGLPLATHANLIRMTGWMPFSLKFSKWVARLNFFYEKGHFPEYDETESVPAILKREPTTFFFLNLPPQFNPDDVEEDDVIAPLIEASNSLEEGKPLTLIPLTLAFDRRPGKAKKSLIDILFGEKENPGSLRKTALFFRNYKKRAVAQVGNPLDVKKFLSTRGEKPLAQQASQLRFDLHKIFFKEQQAITGPRLKSRKRMIEIVMQDPSLRDELKHLATEQKKTLDQLYLEAEKILEEIVSDPNYTYIDVWYVVLTAVFKYVYEGLIVDEAGLNRLKQVARHHPVVLVPSHRSHVDYLLLSYIFYQQHLSMPLIAAGSNLSFWPMGHIFRKSGAYFIRRSFGSDKLYPLLFKAYVKTLVKEGYYQEFFIEGTRSRTGKLERPRTGLLSIYLDCFFEGSAEDIYFIPMSINYEKVLEEGSYTAEVKGATKEKEKFWDLFRIRKYLRHRSGQVYVNFAEPISLKEYLARKGLKSGDSEEAKREVVKHLAHRIAVEIEEVSIASASGLVAAGLLSCGKKGQTTSELMERIECIRQALALRNVELSEPLKKSYPKALHQAILRYQHQGTITEHHDGIETFYTLEESRRLQLDFYKNFLIHNLAHLSLLSSLFLMGNRNVYSKVELEKNYQEFSEIFHYEFINLLPFREALADLTSLGALEEKGEDYVEAKSKPTLQTFGSLFTHFLEAYEITALALKRLSFSKTEEKAVVKRILDLGHQLYLKGDIRRPESLSRFILHNALLSFKEKGLIKTHEKEIGKGGLQIYSSSDSGESLDEMIRLLKGESLQDEKKTPSLVLLQK